MESPNEWPEAREEYTTQQLLEFQLQSKNQGRNALAEQSQVLRKPWERIEDLQQVELETKDANGSYTQVNKCFLSFFVLIL